MNESFSEQLMSGLLMIVNENSQFQWAPEALLNETCQSSLMVGVEEFVHGEVYQRVQLKSYLKFQIINQSKRKTSTWYGWFVESSTTIFDAKQEIPQVGGCSMR